MRSRLFCGPDTGLSRLLVEDCLPTIPHYRDVLTKGGRHASNLLGVFAIFASDRPGRLLRASPTSCVRTGTRSSRRADISDRLSISAHWVSRVGIALGGPIEPILDGFDRHVRRRQGRCPPVVHSVTRFGCKFSAALASSCVTSRMPVSFPIVTNRIVSFPPLFVSFCQ